MSGERFSEYFVGMLFVVGIAYLFGGWTGIGVVAGVAAFALLATAVLR